MDKTKQFKDHYNSITNLIDTSHILALHRECDGVLLNFSDMLDSNFDELKTAYQKYMSLIQEPNSQLLAMFRVKEDAELAKETFRNHLPFELMIEDYELTTEEIDNVCFETEHWFNRIAFELINEDLKELEFNIISSSQKKRKNKQELSLTQKQINLLFHSLRENKVITDKVTDVARGLSTMTGLGYNFYNQNLSNPLSEAKDSIPTDADFVKAVNSLQKSIDYLNDLKVKNGIK